MPRLEPALLALVFQQRGLGCIEHETDGVQRDDGREQRGARLHEVARREPVTGDVAVERRDHARELEVQRVRVDARLRRRHIRRGLQLGGRQRLQVRLADHMRLDERLAALVAGSAFTCAAWARASCALIAPAARRRAADR